MGWFDGLFGGSSDSDPLSKLDPKVREFLQKESPIKYQSQEQALQGVQRTKEVQRLVQKTAQDTNDSPDKPLVPPQSLFQDGRYAHLWKTYRPLSEIEAETKSDNDRLMDVLDAYKDRKARIGRAALENCAVEQIDWNTCMKEGSLGSRMTMCHAEMKKFERCYNMQSRLLKALGYLSAYDRPASVEDDIQIHADTLFHRMLDQEAEIEKAKAEGRTVPKPAPVPLDLPPSTATAATTADNSESLITDEIRKSWDEKLAKMPANDRAAEEAALRAELVTQNELAKRVRALREEQSAERELRKAEGKATLGDRVISLFGGK